MRSADLTGNSARLPPGPRDHDARRRDHAAARLHEQVRRPARRAAVGVWGAGEQDPSGALAEPLEGVGDRGVGARLDRFILLAGTGLSLDPVVDLVAEDRDIARGGDPKAHLLPRHGEDLHFNAVADHDALARLPCQHQHGSDASWRFAYPRRLSVTLLSSG